MSIVMPRQVRVLDGEVFLSRFIGRPSSVIRSARISKFLSAMSLGETMPRSSTYGNILQLCLPIMWEMASATIWNAAVLLAHPTRIAGSIYHWPTHVMPTLTTTTGSALRLRKACAMSILQSIRSLGMLKTSCTMSSIFGNLNVNGLLSKIFLVT